MALEASEKREKGFGKCSSLCILWSHMAASILFVGDIHLGRRPSHLPAHLGEHGIRPRELGPLAAWWASVELAISRGVDAVVLAGDVVESTNARFAALPVLKDGARRLVEAGVQVFAVAGNHDVEALPRLARAVSDFQLLGHGGRWERAEVLRGGSETVAYLVGWSFPQKNVRASPFTEGELPERMDDGCPILGVLHCDLDVARSTNAPVARRVLEDSPLDGWLLGHIHKPTPLQAPRPIGYLGSITPLDRTETGVHGPWLVEIGDDRALRVEQQAIAPLRWEDVEVDASGATDMVELLAEALAEVEARVVDTGGAHRAVGCRVVLSGAVEDRAALHEELRVVELGALARRPGDTLFFVGDIRDRTRLAVDLEDLARGNDPPALLARQILALKSGEAEAAELVEVARRDLSRVAGEASWGGLPRPTLDDEALAARLREAGMRALEALLVQQAGHAKGGS